MPVAIARYVIGRRCVAPRAGEQRTRASVVTRQRHDLGPSTSEFIPRGDRFDAARRRLHVAESCTEVSGRVVWSTPKTHQSRSVPLPGPLADRIAAIASMKGPEDLIFTAPEGGVLRLGNWRARVFEPACRAAGIDGVPPHDMRHTAASLHIAAGANVKAVQRMLGHASGAMTLDVYAGLCGDDLDALGEAMGLTTGPGSEVIRPTPLSLIASCFAVLDVAVDKRKLSYRAQNGALSSPTAFLAALDT